MMHFNYKNKCGIYILRYLKNEVAWAIDKQFQFISKIILLKTVIFTVYRTKEESYLMFKTILHMLQHIMCSLIDM